MGKKKKREKKKGEAASALVLDFTYMLAARKKKKKKTGIGCGFISYSKIWQTCANVIACKALLSTSFLVTGSQQYCKKSVLAGKVRLFSNRKQETEIGKEQMNVEGKKR